MMKKSIYAFRATGNDLTGCFWEDYDQAGARVRSWGEGVTGGT